MLNVGDPAPAFAVQDHTGATRKLSDYRGQDRRPLVLPEGRHPRLNDRGLRVPRPLCRVPEEERRDPGRLVRHGRGERRLREEVRLPVSAALRREARDRRGLRGRRRRQGRLRQPHHLRDRARRQDRARPTPKVSPKIASEGDPGRRSRRTDRFRAGGYTSPMAVDPELLAILVCPKTKGPLELVELKESTRKALVEKYREKFRDEEPVVTQGLFSKQADLVYPIVSDIPVMLIDEALPGLGGGGAADADRRDRRGARAGLAFALLVLFAFLTPSIAPAYIVFGLLLSAWIVRAASGRGAAAGEPALALRLRPRSCSALLTVALRRLLAATRPSSARHLRRAARSSCSCRSRWISSTTPRGRGRSS